LNTEGFESTGFDMPLYAFLSTGISVSCVIKFIGSRLQRWLVVGEVT